MVMTSLEMTSKPEDQLQKNNRISIKKKTKSDQVWFCYCGVKAFK
jgi:hypothetical protein